MGFCIFGQNSGEFCLIQDSASDWGRRGYVQRGGDASGAPRDYATIASPFFSTIESSLSEAPDGLFSPRSPT